MVPDEKRIDDEYYTVMNNSKTGKIALIAEAMNNKLQRFITANYGIRDKDFFMYRFGKYYW